MGVGRQLRDVREARGVTLTTLAERTKIPVRQLQMLEAEEYHRLPAGIFGRGYVRAVAKALALDADRLVNDFREEQEPAAEAVSDATQPGRSVAFSEPEDEMPRLRLAADDDAVVESHGGRRVLAVALVAVSVILAMLWLGRDAASGDRGAERSAVAVETSGAGEAAPGAEPSIPQPRVGTAGAVDPAAGPSPPLDARENLEPDTTAGRAEPAAGAPLEVVVEARDRCWVTLQADGRRIAFRMFEAGETITATARQQVMVRAGNPPALRLTVNGTRAGMGPAGRERELHLTPANYRRVLGSE
jgi:cytoskeleton protein RodZ